MLLGWVLVSMPAAVVVGMAIRTGDRRDRGVDRAEDEDCDAGAVA
jgi:hypothetical protein